MDKVEFEEYAARAGIQDARDKNITFFAWNARQPEIDALKEEVERLKVKIKLMSTPDAEMKERK